jgi:hypothetical protein
LIESLVVASRKVDLRQKWDADFVTSEYSRLPMTVDLRQFFHADRVNQLELELVIRRHFTEASQRGKRTITMPETVDGGFALRFHYDTKDRLMRIEAGRPTNARDKGRNCSGYRGTPIVVLRSSGISPYFICLPATPRIVEVQR